MPAVTCAQVADKARLALQVVLSHTPFQRLSERFRDLPVLLGGRGKTPEVARAYGFHRTITTEQLGRALPNALPFSTEYAGRQADSLADVQCMGISILREPLAIWKATS